jgi:hypothetical protein
MLGVIRAPRRTFEALAGSPRWASVLLATFIVTAVSSAVLLETDVGQLALLDQWERTAAAFGQDVSAEEYAAMEAASENGAAYAFLTALTSGPLLAFAIAAVLWTAFRLARAPRVAYGQVLSAVAHAGVILMLRQVVATPVIYARETLASPVTMSLFFAVLDEASPLARFFAVMDLFVIWWVVVLAIGMSVVYGRSARRLAAVFAGVYVLLGALLAIVMALTGGTG